MDTTSEAKRSRDNNLPFSLRSISSLPENQQTCIKITAKAAGSSGNSPARGPNLDGGDTGTDGGDYDRRGGPKGQGAERRSCLVKEIVTPEWLRITLGTFDVPRF